MKLNDVRIVVLIGLLIGWFLFGVLLQKDNNSKNIPSVTVYMVRNGDTDRTIHRVFLSEKAVKQYVNNYKESHAYEYEVVLLNE